MRNFLSERNLVGILFVASLVILFFAKQDTNRIEKMYRNTLSSAANPLPAPQPTAQNTDTTHHGLLPGTRLQ